MLREKANKDSGFQGMLMAACRESPLYWLNAFAWTFRQKQVDIITGSEVPITGPACHVPFISWVVQDEAVTAVMKCINEGDDINFEKSRDMGASWLLLAMCDWYFLFKDSANIGMASRKEDLVDKQGDMDSLIEKIRYIHRTLPGWMLPRMKDKFMFLHNLDYDTTLIGESTNADIGRGGRKTFYVVDEAAAIPNADRVEAALSANTACQIWASTPHGPNTQFHKRIKEGRGACVQLPWWRHPEKAHGAYQIQDEAGKVVWTSPWKKRQDEKFSRKTVAQEIEMDHGQSGDMFFDYTELTRHTQDHVCKPVKMGNLVWMSDMPVEDKYDMLAQYDPSDIEFIESYGKCPWKLWIPLGSDGRPNQNHTYAMGIDISNGSGGSNSVISVIAVDTGMIVAKFWSAYVSPEDLALVACSAGMWFGGAKPPAFMCWENNGPGGIFGRKVVYSGYPFFYRQRQDDTLSNTRSPRWGWHSNRARKEQVLGMYRDALGRDDIINPCVESLEECADYIYDPSGRLIPASIREEPSGGHELHGDHVIADALCWVAAQELPKHQHSPVRAPRGSYAWRVQKRKHSKHSSDPWRR